MINKKPSSVLATFKNLVILPVVAIVAYAFTTPEYTYITPESEPLTIYEGQKIILKEVKEIVVEATNSSATAKLSLPAQVSDNTTYVIVEEMPQYPEGMKS